MRSHARSVGLSVVLLAAASAALLLNCSRGGGDEPAPDDVRSEDAITGVNNALGLALSYDKESGALVATMNQALADGLALHIRVRRGFITHESQAELDCAELAKTPALTRADGKSLPIGKAVYKGPPVSEELLKLLDLYNDPRWYGGHETPEMKAELAKGTDSIVEACVMKDGKVEAKLQTNLAYAMDRGEELVEDLQGAGGGDLSTLQQREAGTSGRLRAGREYNTIDYARICVQELGEIPFFKKISEGKYETFDCRDFVGSNGRRAPAAIAGVEGRGIPLTVDDVPRETCDRGADTDDSYDCVSKCDRAMWLPASSHTGLGRKASCQPGPTVTTAKNEQGTHWILLCRKVEDTGTGMMKSKRFNDIAVIGHNPRSGKACFFQNKENIGNDGSRVVHPGDVARSNAIWPAKPSSYCTENCHAADVWIHSPWIDEAKRGDGSPIVPMMGVHPDYPISDLSKPYSLVNGPAQGFVLPKQLVSEAAAPCTTCHRVAGKAFGEFADWSTGKGAAYFDKITPSYKTFEKSHWMPPRLEGLTAENFEASEWGQAVKHINVCMSRPSAPECEWADIPR
jgi:hypothetical protein